MWYFLKNFSDISVLQQDLPSTCPDIYMICIIYAQLSFV